MLQQTCEYSYFSKILISVLLNKVPRSELAGSYGSSTFNFLKQAKCSVTDEQMKKMWCIYIHIYMYIYMYMGIFVI